MGKFALSQAEWFQEVAGLAGSVKAWGTSAAGLLTVVVSVQTIAISFSSVSHEKRTATLAWHEQRLQEEQVVENFRKIKETIWDIREKHPNFARSPENYQQFKGYSLEHSKAIRSEILFALDFYKGVSNCVNEGVCAQDITQALFEDDVKEFTVIFAPLICESRMALQDPHFAEELEAFYAPVNPVCPEQPGTGRN